jgi:hypothetical protein
VDEDSNLLAHDATLIDKQLLPFQRTYLHPSSWYKQFTPSSWTDWSLKLKAGKSSSNVSNSNHYGVKSQKTSNLHVIVHKEWMYSDAFVPLAEKTPTLQLSRVGGSITLPNTSTVLNRKSHSC